VDVISTFRRHCLIRTDGNVPAFAVMFNFTTGWHVVTAVPSSMKIGIADTVSSEIDAVAGFPSDALVFRIARSRFPFSNGPTGAAHGDVPFAR